MSEVEGVLAKRLRKQAASCRYLGSELYGSLLHAAAEDAVAGGPTSRLMEPLAFAPPGAAIGLRLMGSVHRLVLEGKAPALARHYASAGGDDGPEGAWVPFRDLLEERRTELGRLIDRPVQTNEVGRSAALLGGFLDVARATALPLRILEIGASAGLNLRWDHYRYVSGATAWGPEDSPVRLEGFESALDLSTSARVEERVGCDPAPVDPTTEEGRLTLASYVWPDQAWRWAQLKGALQVAKSVPATVERSGASDWVGRALAEPVRGRATVIFHSIVMQYIEPDERRRVASLIGEAGERATQDSPVARLAMEPPDPVGDLADVRVTLWPGGAERLIARAGYHGRPVISLI